jgi:hypothetical protein
MRGQKKVIVPFLGFETLVNQEYLRQAARQAADEGMVLRVQAKNPGTEMHLHSLEMLFNDQDAFAAQ